MSADSSVAKITVGTDAEVFLKDKNGKYIASCGKFGGTKEKPLPILTGDGYAIQEDNVALEFNIPPANNSYAFYAHIAAALDECTQRATEKGLIIAMDAAANFTTDQLRSRQARTFGCDPDYNVWRLAENPRPHCDDPTLRTAAAHVHIGGFTQDNIGLGRACDLFLGVPSIALDPDTKRRQLYGKAGAIRIKPYGIEYRTLSNFWLKMYPTWVFNQALKAVEFVSNKQMISDDDARKIIKCINTHDMDLLRELTVRYQLEY